MSESARRGRGDRSFREAEGRTSGAKGPVGRLSLVPRPRAALSAKARERAGAAARARRHRGDQRRREASRVPRARPTTTAAAAERVAGAAPPQEHDHGLRPEQRLQQRLQQRPEQRLQQPREHAPGTQPSGLKDATRDHRLAPSGRDHLSAVQHGARLPRRHEKRNRELKGRPRVRRTGGGSGGSGSGSGSSRGSPAGSPLRRHGSVVKFDDSLDELFEFEDRPYHNLDRASWATPQYLPTGVNFINPQGRRRPLMRKRPQTPEERYAPVPDESSYSLSTRVKWKPSWSTIDSSLVSSGAATIRGRRGLEELRRMRERQSVRDAKGRR